MPTYCYKREDNGEIVEKFFPIGKAPQSIEFNVINTTGSTIAKAVTHVTAHRNIVAEQRKSKPRNAGQWPRESHAFGCAPHQAKAFTEKTAAMGVPTEFSKETGCAVIKSESHQRKLLRAMDMHNKDAYYD
jgi:hypothetical protein